MNICLTDWNGVLRCTAPVMQRIHDTTPGGADGTLAMALLFLAPILWFVFRDPT